MKILSIDTSQKNTHITLDLNGKVLSESSVAFVPHSKTLMTSIEKLMIEGKVSIDDLDAIAVVTGPGSFTGCRLSLSIAKGMAYPHNIPLIAITSLELLLYPFKNEKNVISVLKGIGNELFVLNNNQMYLDNVDNFIQNLSKDTSVIVLDLDNLQLPNQKQVAYSTQNLALLAREKFEKNDFTDIVELKPLYLRECQAEIELKRKLNV